MKIRTQIKHLSHVIDLPVYSVLGHGHADIRELYVKIEPDRWESPGDYMTDSWTDAEMMNNLPLVVLAIGEEDQDNQEQATTDKAGK